MAVKISVIQGKLAASFAAIAFATMTVTTAHADPEFFSPNEERWLGHIHNNLGVDILDPIAAAHTGYQICTAAMTAPDTATGTARMDALLAGTAQPLTNIQRLAVEGSALNLLCHNYEMPADHF